MYLGYIKCSLQLHLVKHTESEILVRNFRTLKNKYDLMLCQSRLHTASKIFVHKKNSDQVRFSAFLHP